MTDAEVFRGPAQRPALLDGTAGRAQASGRGQRGVAVGREGLLQFGVNVAFHTGTKALLPFKNRPGRVACHQRPRTAQLGRVVKVS
ncbi:hypothetical protein Acsp04_29200 [Actinomadura sp. NBRC 104425]|nr:hypothetical protein Acsp04_29200 [Actinomadura sp. NBRC 104425]